MSLRSNRLDPLGTVKAALAHALKTLGDLGDPQRPHPPPCNCAKALQELRESILEAIRNTQQILNSPDNTSASEGRLPCPYTNVNTSTSPPSSSISPSSSPATPPRSTSASAAARPESIHKRRSKTAPAHRESDVVAKRRRKHQDVGSRAEATVEHILNNDTPASDAATALGPGKNHQHAPVGTDNLHVPIDEPPTTDSLPRQSHPSIATSSGLLSQSSATTRSPTIAWEADANGVAVLKPSASQLKEFDVLLAYACTSTDAHVRSKGIFKISLPPEHNTSRHVPAQYKPCRMYESHAYPQGDIFHIKNRNGRKKFGPERPACDDFTSNSPPSSSAEEEVRKQDDRLRNNSLKGVYYATDMLAADEADRRARGLPAVSPIHPLAGDQLNKTTCAIQGIHSPYCYESDHKEGAPFLLHTEDFQLCSVNLLHQGRKIWICIFPDASNELEDKLRQVKPGGKSMLSCSQFIRHACIYISTAELEKWGIPYTIVDQRAGEIVVTLPSTYHQGFSLGYTKAEAVNYADKKWDPANTRNPCSRSCPKFAITHDDICIEKISENSESDQALGAEVKQAVTIQESISQCLASQSDGFQKLFTSSNSNLGDIQKVRVLELVLQCAWPEMPTNFIPERSASNITKQLQNIRAQGNFNAAQERVMLALLARAHRQLVQEIEAERVGVRRAKNRRHRNEKKTIHQKSSFAAGGRTKAAKTVASETMMEGSDMAPRVFQECLKDGCRLLTIAEQLEFGILISFPVRDVQSQDFHLSLTNAPSCLFLEQPITSSR
ncbi:unnamed protein product [Clonostachys byssicola]|uniref:JmjC domain-containing protein n=1 Tax=Clonostachys byssicola TaxID=160290 RepID=A0A9N9Y241_9HYPO|nr:unnamed protein product [Clonostachys byssicola]